jgi:hypothetical protein
VRLAGIKNLSQCSHKSDLRSIIGPEGKNSTRVQLFSESAEAFGTVKFPVSLVKEIGRRMINVEENGVEPMKAFIGR